MQQLNSKQNVCLIVIDGWGVSDPKTTELDAISAAETPKMTYLMKNASTTQLIAHGSHVGLPADLMGNSEVGHLNIGAGRIVYQDITRIDHALQTGELKEKISSRITTGSNIHLVGLVSDGGVHSSLQHLLKFIDIIQDSCGSCTVHAITDGRDTAPCSALKYLSQVNNHLGTGSQLGTVIGRYYAMDRDKRWERTQLALTALCKNDNMESFSTFTELEKIIEARYEKDETDEFFKPIIRVNSRRIHPQDTVIFFNFRSDRMRQIVSKFIESHTGQILCMTRYSEDFDLPVLSPPQSLTNVLSECISKAALSQCHIAGFLYF